MKRTTYILIGVFFGNILLVTAVMIYLRTTFVPYDQMGIILDFKKDTTSIDLKGVHKLEFITSGANEENFYYGFQGKVFLIPVVPDNKERIIYPDSEYLKLEKQDGVMRVMLDLTSATKQMKENSKRNRVVLKDLLFYIEIGTAFKEISAGKGFDVEFRNIQLDSLRLNTNCIRLDSCSIGSIVVEGSRTDFRSKELHADNLYLDLDKTDRWKLEKGKIGTLHLTGSKHSRAQLSDNQYDRLRWKPKNEKSELRVTLKKEAEVVKVID